MGNTNQKLYSSVLDASLQVLVLVDLAIFSMQQGNFSKSLLDMGMGSRNFSPDDRPSVRFMVTEELAYVAMRAREVQCMTYCILFFGLNTNLIGESALKVIEVEEMLLPMCLLSVTGGTTRFNEKQRNLFFQHYLPYATRPVISVYYERHFHKDFEVLGEDGNYSCSCSSKV